MIDNSLSLPIFHKSLLESYDKTHFTVLNKEVERLMSVNKDCWGRLDTNEDTWSSYPLNKDILFNNDIFNDISSCIREHILQYAMGVRADTQSHQVHLMDSSIYVCKSNPRREFSCDLSQHFIGYLFLQAEGNAGNIIIKNPFAPKKKFFHDGSSPLREYLIKHIDTADLLILPSHVEHKMSDFMDNEELRTIQFSLTVA